MLPFEVTSTSPNQPSAPDASEPGRTAGLVAVLSALTAIAPLTTDMYVPALPSMGDAPNAGSTSIQLTLTSFLVGLFGESSSLPMAVVMLGAILLAALALVTLARPWLRPGEVSEEAHTSR